jgi:hypothetical protein
VERSQSKRERSYSSKIATSPVEHERRHGEGGHRRRDVAEPARVVDARAAGEPDACAVLVDEDPPAVDLLLVNPALAVKGLLHERRLRQRASREPRLHAYLSTRLGGTEGQLAGILAAFSKGAPACVCVAVGATRSPAP